MLKEDLSNIIDSVMVESKEDFDKLENSVYLEKYNSLKIDFLRDLEEFKNNGE